MKSTVDLVTSPPMPKAACSLNYLTLWRTSVDEMVPIMLLSSLIKIGSFFGKFGWCSSKDYSSTTVVCLSSYMSVVFRWKITAGISLISYWPSFQRCKDSIRSLPITKYNLCVSLYNYWRFAIKCAVGIDGPLSTSIESTVTGKLRGKKSLTAALVISSL
jgi:hypothetical protein